MKKYKQGDICPSCLKGKIKTIKSKFSDGYFGGCNNYPQCNFSVSEYYFEQKRQSSFLDKLTPFNSALNDLELDFREDKSFEKIYHTDGFVFGMNPSPHGGGYTITDNEMKILKREEIKKPNFTNNEAELLGVFNAFQIMEENSTLITDSTNSFYWVRKGKSKARKDLSHICKEANQLLKEKKLKLIWKPREENKAGILNENYLKS